MSKEQPKEPQEDKPFHFFHIDYEGSVEEFKKLLKKKIGFDFKDIGNKFIFSRKEAEENIEGDNVMDDNENNQDSKIKTPDFETFSLFIQGAKLKGGAVKNYFEIKEDVYAGALLSLDKILQG